MLVYLIILFTVVPAIELTLLIKVGAVIGAANTILIILLTGMAGGWLARMQGFRTLEAIQRSLAQGIMPTEEMLDGALILAGGLLLLTPGFITDILGLILLIPPARKIVKYLIRRRVHLGEGNEPRITPKTSHRDPERPKNVEDADYY